MKLGFLGTGAIASAMVTGLNSGGDSGYAIVLSPRNAETASNLSGHFPAVSVAGSNQEVVDACDIVVIAVRPQIARDVLAELQFRPAQNIISLVSGIPIGKLLELVSPAIRVSRAVPLPAVARRRCVTPIYPHDPESQKLFSLLGSAFAVNTEREFDVLCAATAAMATYFAFANGVAGWLTRHGIAEVHAREYMASVLSGLADAAIESPRRSFAELAADHATRGGTNEQLLKYLEAQGGFARLSEGVDGILQRVTAASQ